MTEEDVTTPHRSRWPILLGVLVLLVGGSFLGVRLLLDPERVSDFLLARAGQALGLEISVSEPAGIGLLPHLAIELYGVTARVPGDPAVLFSANFVEIALPWSSLGGEHIEVTSLRMDQAVLHLSALQAWREESNDAPAGPPAPLRLPPFDTPLKIRSGRVIGADWRLASIDAEASPLRNGDAFALQFSASFERNGSAQPVAFALDAVPHQRIDGIELEGVDLRATLPELTFQGSADLAPPLRLSLQGVVQFPDWPTSLPNLLPDDGSDDGYRMRIDANADVDARGTANLTLERGAEQIRGALQTGALLDWLQEPGGRVLPPLDGEFESRRLMLQGVELKGVQVRIEARPPESAADHEPAQ